MENRSSGTRLRKPAGDSQINEAISTATKDPLVRASAKPPSKSAVDEKWDLEDDEDWVDGQTPGKEQTETDQEVSRRRRVLKRGVVEVGIAFAFHLAILCAYIYIHVYDATVVKKTQGKGFPGLFTYGGRWKYLTYISLWVQFLYFFLCFLTDIMPWGSAKYWFLRSCDFLFTTVAFPWSIFVSVMFWGIYLADREVIHPAELDEFIPVSLNHCWHTFPLVITFLEAMVVFHRYPSSMWCTFVVFMLSTLYIVWIVWVFTAAKIWPYDFFKLLPLPSLPLFFLANFFIVLVFQFLGKLCCYLRWKERHDLMEEMGL